MDIQQTQGNLGRLPYTVLKSDLNKQIAKLHHSPQGSVLLILETEILL